MINRRTIIQYLYNYVSQMILFVAPLIVIPHVSRVLGPENIGSYSYTQSIVTIVILLSTMGIGVYAQRETAAVADNKEKRSQLFWELFSFRIVTVLCGLVVYILAVSFLADKVLSLLFLIQCIDIAASAGDITWFYYGTGKYRKLACCNVLVKLAYVCSVLLFVKAADDLWIYVLCHSISLLLGNVLLCLLAGKEITWKKVKRQEIRQHLMPILLLFFPQVATQVYTVMDKSMLGWLAKDMSESGYYEQSVKIVHTLLMLITSFGVVMLSNNTQKLQESQNELKRTVAEAMEFIFFIAIPIVFGCIAVADEIVLLLLGSSFLPAVNIIRVLSLTILFIAATNVLGVQYLLVLKKQKEYTISVLAGAVVNLVLNCIFITKWNAIGAAVASVIAELVVLIVQSFFVKGEITFSCDKLKNIGKCLMAAAFMLILVVVLPTSELSIWFGLLVKVFAGMGSYFLAGLVLQERYCRKILAVIRKSTKGKASK